MLVGREVEKRRLERVYRSPEAEFVVLYGRRRVGKTYLIRQFFEEKNIDFFQVTGLQKGALKTQLAHFAEALSKTFTHGVPIRTPASWEEAFQLLSQLIEASISKTKKVIFLDELPWMATRRSGLLQALDYYWNHRWSKDPSIILIVCGSSASWLINNIIYNKGGLHNRCTCEIKLDPFNLNEAYAYLTSKGIKLNKKHVLELYMALGGVPYYLKYVEPGLSATENIQNILFDKKAALGDEFTKLFYSLFTEASAYIELISLIAEKKGGISRVTLEKNTSLSKGGGRLSLRLNQLQQTSFIESYRPWGKKKGEYFKLIDEFCLFYLTWVAPVQQKRLTHDHWFKQTRKPEHLVWAGYAFEAICHKHIDQITDALQIKTAESISSWRFMAKDADEVGAQIDLLIERGDDAITLCEIKYTSKPFLIDKAYFLDLNRKMEVFQRVTGTEKQLFMILISANGLKENQYSHDLIQGVVTLVDLFHKGPSPCRSP